MGAAIESAAFDSYVSDDLPLSVCEGALPCGGRLSSAQQTIFIAATTCRQLPALLTSVSNSIAGSVLPPSVCEGALPYARGRFLAPLSDLLSPLSGVTSLIS